MSRYGHKIKKEDKEYEVAYGFDRQCSEYFIQVFDNSMPEDRECIIWEGSRMTGKSNSEMLDLFTLWGVPEIHRTAVTLDNPF